MLDSNKNDDEAEVRAEVVTKLVILVLEHENFWEGFLSKNVLTLTSTKDAFELFLNSGKKRL